MSDRSVPLSHEIGFNGACTYNVLSDLELVVALLKGTTCGGEEVRCLHSTDLGDGMSPRYRASITLGNADNGNYVMVIESPHTQATVGAALLITSAITGAMTASAEDDLRSSCKTGVCDEDARDSGMSLQVATNVLLPLGLATLTGAVPQARLDVGCVPGARAVQARGSF